LKTRGFQQFNLGLPPYCRQDHVSMEGLVAIRVIIILAIFFSGCSENGEGGSPEEDEDNPNYIIPASTGGGGSSTSSYDTAKANLKFNYEQFDNLDDDTGNIEVEVFGASGYDHEEQSTISKSDDARELVVSGIPVGTISYEMKLTTENCLFTYWGTIDLTAGQIYVIKVYFPKTCKVDTVAEVPSSNAEVFYVGVYEGQGQDTYQNGRPLGTGQVGVIVTRKDTPAILVLTSDRPTVFNIDIKSYSAGVEAVIMSGKYPSIVKGIPSDTPVYASSEIKPDPMSYGAGVLKSSSIPVFHAYESDAGLFSDFVNGKPTCTGSTKKPESKWLDAKEIIYNITGGKDIASADSDKIGHTYHITDFSEIWDLPAASTLDDSCE
jgi:hypothetical protein